MERGNSCTMMWITVAVRQRAVIKHEMHCSCESAKALVSRIRLMWKKIDIKSTSKRLYLIVSEF